MIKTLLLLLIATLWVWSAADLGEQFNPREKAIAGMAYNCGLAYGVVDIAHLAVGESDGCKLLRQYSDLMINGTKRTK